MNRLEYFNFIEEKLNLLAVRIALRGGLNILDLHLHSEDFYTHFLNLLFDWNLVNTNTIQQNTPGIDLVDIKNRIVVQVSATATKQKIQSALSKNLSGYQRYTFKFIAITSKDISNLKKNNSFNNPHALIFSPSEDILDIQSLLKFIKCLDIDSQKKVYEFLKKELKSETDPEKLETNLAAIIEILSSENWNNKNPGYETIPFDIEAKISFNELDTTVSIIKEHKIHFARIDKIYSTFDKAGVNKSLSILNTFHSEYVTQAQNLSLTPDKIFLSIVDGACQKVKASANYVTLPDEELTLCVQILIVDAFIRCKIFKNPEGY